MICEVLMNQDILNPDLISVFDNLKLLFKVKTHGSFHQHLATVWRLYNQTLLPD